MPAVIPAVRHSQNFRPIGRSLLHYGYFLSSSHKGSSSRFSTVKVSMLTRMVPINVSPTLSSFYSFFTLPLSPLLPSQNSECVCAHVQGNFECCSSEVIHLVF